MTIRDEKGKILKGHSLNPAGKPKGAVTHTSKEVRDILTNIVSRNLETVDEDLKALKPKDRIDALVAICQIILPKFSAVAVTSENENGERVKQVMMFGETKIEF